MTANRPRVYLKMPFKALSNCQLAVNGDALPETPVWRDDRPLCGRQREWRRDQFHQFPVVSKA